MAHLILNGRFAERLGEGRRPAWHGVGQSWQGPKTAVEAVTESGVSAIRIQTRKMGYQLEDGSFVPMDTKSVIVRCPLPEDPTYVPLGTAGADYTVLQNSQIAEALDAAGITSRWPVETCGALGKGETLFICLSMGQDSIAGDEHQKYAIITDTRNGTTSLQLLTTYTRVVCQNTLNIALRSGTVKLNLLHTPDLSTDFRFSLDVMDQVEASSAAVKTALETLHAITVQTEDLPAVWEATYVDPAKGTLLQQYERVDDPTRFDPATLARLLKMKENYDYYKTLRDTLKAAAVERYDVLCQEAPHLAGTALGVLNTVAEIADHTRAGRTNACSIIGSRGDEKLRCYAKLLTLA